MAQPLHILLFNDISLAFGFTATFTIFRTLSTPTRLRYKSPKWTTTASESHHYPFDDKSTTSNELVSQRFCHHSTCIDRFLEFSVLRAEVSREKQIIAQWVANSLGALVFFSMPCRADSLWCNINRSIRRFRANHLPVVVAGCGLFRNFRMYLTLDLSRKSHKAWWQSNTPQKILLSTTEAAQGDGLTHTTLSAIKVHTHNSSKSVAICGFGQHLTCKSLMKLVDHIGADSIFDPDCKKTFSVKWSANCRWQKMEAKRQSR